MRVRRTPEGDWELVHPRCAKQRKEDIEEVEHMIEAGEPEIARDELVWLLSECHDFIQAHRMLGDLALAQGDLPLARAHYGYAYRLGESAVRRAGKVRRLPYTRPANRDFLEAGERLVHCLELLDHPAMALEVAEQLLALDPSDPLDLRSRLERITSAAAASRKP